MKICIYGAGAIGGYLGFQLAEAGAEVTLIARGPHLAAIKENGLTLRIDGAEKNRPIAATDDAAEAGPQDYVVVALKAPSVAPVADRIAELFHEETAVVTAMNGIPYWYFHAHGGAHDGMPLEAVDPGRVLWDTIGPERAIGCVVYPAAEIAAPGIVEHVYGNRFMLGEPDGVKSERVQALSTVMNGAGLKAPVRPRIRDDIWTKLWGNLSFNPVSCLTGGTLEEIANDPGTRDVVRRMMAESKEVGEALGVRFSVPIEKRIDMGGDVGAHKTSMLQDLERGRSMELDALVGVISELGRMVGVETPTVDAVFSLAAQRGRLAGCYS